VAELHLVQFSIGSIVITCKIKMLQKSCWTYLLRWTRVEDRPRVKYCTL